MCTEAPKCSHRPPSTWACVNNPCCWCGNGEPHWTAAFQASTNLLASSGQRNGAATQLGLSSTGFKFGRASAEFGLVANNFELAETECCCW